MLIQDLLKSNNPSEVKAVFAFKNDTSEMVIFKFQLWTRHFFPKYFTSDDAPFHREIDLHNLQAYRGEISTFVDIVFRGGAKTARTKLFLAFAIANDLNHSRKYIKVLSQDGVNSKQIVTDIYNMLIDPKIQALYPEIFQKTFYKREETMTAFTTAAGVKILADTVGTAGRGAIQEEARPDFVWFEDFENRTTLRSAIITKSIWDNMEEARTGLAKGGACVYTCNYISERGNVHTLVTRPYRNKVLMIVPIIDEFGVPTWSRYSLKEIDDMRQDDEDFEGERLCKPSASKDIIFDRERLDNMEVRPVIRDIAGFRVYRAYDASHRYAGGADVAGGVGLDSSTSVFIDFDTFPAQVVATFDNNLIKPDIFGDELARQGDFYGQCLLAPEKNNHGHATIGRLKQVYPKEKIHKTQRKETKIKKPELKDYVEYGWETNALTKPKMLFDLVKAVDNGFLVLNCPHLIAEARSYTRNDLMDAEVDVRLTTRHFDLLTAAAIAWQMNAFSGLSKDKKQRIISAQDYINEEGFDPLAVI